MLTYEELIEKAKVPTGLTSEYQLPILQAHANTLIMYMKSAGVRDEELYQDYTVTLICMYISSVQAGGEMPSMLQSMITQLALVSSFNASQGV